MSTTNNPSILDALMGDEGVPVTLSWDLPSTMIAALVIFLAVGLGIALGTKWAA